jgi:phospholipid transport system transporter-binding protein
VDSAALAVVFAWLRDAHSAKRTLSFASVPQQLVSLAAVYGVSDLLPLA